MPSVGDLVCALFQALSLPADRRKEKRALLTVLTVVVSYLIGVIGMQNISRVLGVHRSG